jgi:hypothetical protein
MQLYLLAMVEPHHALLIDEKGIIRAKLARSRERLVRLCVVREHDMLHPHEQQWQMRPAIQYIVSLLTFY